MRKISIFASLLGGLGLSLSSLPAIAGEWIIAPAFTLEQNYTDNALLTRDNKENESITVLRPSLSIYREGARANVDFNYAPEYRKYWQDTENDELVNFLRAEGNVELMEQHLFVDGWATADLTTITSTGRSGIGTLTGRDDNTEVYTAGFSPYAKTRLGNMALLEARYTVDSVTYSEDGLDDNLGQRADLVVGSGPAFSNLIWEVTAMYSRTDYDNLDDDNEVSQFRAELAQQLNSQFALAVAAGYEKYKLALNPDIDDSLWSVGVIFTPNTRTRLSIGGGERAFGDDYYLDFTHRSRRTVWTANYERDYTSARDELLRPTLFQRQDAFGNLIRDPVLDSPPTVDRGNAPAIGTEFYELERFLTNFVFDTGRTAFSIGGGLTKRLYTDVLSNTRDATINAGLTRQVSSRTSAYLNFSGTDHEETALDYKEWVSALGGSYQLGETTSLGMRLSHLTRDAEIELLSYDENSFSLILTMAF